MLLGEQAALLDRRFVARDDQLGFPRIEDIGRGQPGGSSRRRLRMVSALRLASRYCAVADALDDQRDRNVVDDEFEELLGVFQFPRQRLAVGHILEQRDQEFRLALVVAGDHAVAGKRALLRAALDHQFVAELAIGRIERGAVGRRDGGRRLRAEDLVGALADDVLARETRESLESAIGEDVAAVLDILGGDAHRDVVDDRFQKLLGGRQLLRQPALLAAILVRRHRAAVRQREIFDCDRSPVGQFGDETFAGLADAIEIFDADVEHAALAPQLEQFAARSCPAGYPNASSRRFRDSGRCRR